jgi:hypothetical protein
VRACLDDPWEFLNYKGAVFAAVVGRGGVDADACPDAVDVAWIRRVVPDAGDTNRYRWPTDPVWHVVQGAVFAEAPAQARRLIRRRQRGADVAVLDTGQFGYLVSRVAQLHPNGGHWTPSRALGEALPALEAVEAKKQAKTGMDFGELVRERRRQRGLPLPLADKVLPFRAYPPADTSADASASHEQVLPAVGPTPAAATAADTNAPAVDPRQRRAEVAEGRVAEAWARLAAAEQAGSMRRVLGRLEAAYLAELATYQSALVRRAPHGQGAS